MDLEDNHLFLYASQGLTCSFYIHIKPYHHEGFHDDKVNSKLVKIEGNLITESPTVLSQ